MEKLHTLSNLSNRLRGRLKTVVFDVDGTLYPNYQMLFISIPLFIKYPRFVKAFGKMRRNIRRGEIEGGVRASQARIISEYLQIPEEDAARDIERIIYDEWQKMFSIIRPFRGVKEVLGFLKDKGYTLAVLSDFPPEKKLDFLGVSRYFDVVLCSDDSGYLKPDPRAFSFLLERLGIRGEEVLFVGNNYFYDIVGAKEAKMVGALKVSPLKLYNFFVKRRQDNWQLADLIFSSYRSFLEIFR